MGYAMRNVKFPAADVSPYLQLENIDPKWLAAIGYRESAVMVASAREEKEKPVLERKQDGEKAAI